MSRLVGTFGGALLLSATVGCAEPPDDRPTLRVLAPRALQPVLEPVVVTWEAAHGARVQVGFDAPDRLLRQANGGTRADLFVSADPRWMDALVADGHVDGTTRRVLAFDPLVFLAPPGRQPVRDPRDLVVRVAGPIGIVSDDSPEGRLTHDALEETQVWDALADRLQVHRSGAQLRASLERGEAEAAVGLQSTSLLAYDTLSTHPFTPDQAYGSTIEVAPVVGTAPDTETLRQALLDTLADSPDARAAWSRAGMHTLRGPEPPPADGGPPTGPPPHGDAPPGHGAGRPDAPAHPPTRPGLPPDSDGSRPPPAPEPGPPSHPHPPPPGSPPPPPEAVAPPGTPTAPPDGTVPSPGG